MSQHGVWSKAVWPSGSQIGTCFVAFLLNLLARVSLTLAEMERKKKSRFFFYFFFSFPGIQENDEVHENIHFLFLNVFDQSRTPFTEL